MVRLYVVSMLLGAIIDRVDTGGDVFDIVSGDTEREPLLLLLINIDVSFLFSFLLCLLLFKLSRSATIFFRWSTAGNSDLPPFSFWW